MIRSKVGAVSALVAALGVSAVLAAGSLGTASPAQHASAAAVGRSDAGTGTVEVTAGDYAFGGIPERVTAGTAFTLVNVSPVEVHELVAFRLADSETRPVADLLQLPREALETVFGEGFPAMGLVALPMATGMAVIGDGTLSTPGRYALVCFIPTGADPQAFLAALAAATDGPPQVAGGPPHFVLGMFAEVVVE